MIIANNHEAYIGILQQVGHPNSTLPTPKPYSCATFVTLIHDISMKCDHNPQHTKYKFRIQVCKILYP